MKKILVVLTLVMGLSFQTTSVHAQEYEIEQLLLDWQKLYALKNILSDLYKGYEILNQGYGAIKDISEGNFNLHKLFLDGLLQVSPAVKSYEHAAAIIDNDSRLVSEYRSALSRFKKDQHITPDEIIYLGKVYGNLFSESLTDLDNLLNVITDGTLRMSDDESLTAIDGIYSESKQRLVFLRQFNTNTTELAIQRALEPNDVSTLNNLYGLQ